jgi:D-alanyl-D-alanine carboxypeptidase
MRRSIARLTAAAAALAVVAAASLSVGPAMVTPGQGQATVVPHATATPRPAAGLPPPGAVDLPDAFWPIDQGVPGVGSARPVDLLPIPAAQAADLQAAVERARATFGLGAVVVGVSADGRYGWSGASGPPRDGRTPLSGATPFAIASVTKTFTAAIVLQLVDEGLVRLDAEVNDYLPELTVARGVTVRQLLGHTSGIADLLAPMRTRLNAEPSRTWTPGEVLALIGPSVFAPGSDWGYSNSNYVIAGMLVERVTGHPFADELDLRITGPLRLNGTGLAPDHGLPDLLGRSWSSAFWTSAALDSDAIDLVRWGDALYGGAILSPTALAHMLDFNANGYGLGAERYSPDGLLGYGHSGLLRGFTSLLVHIPEAHLTLSVLATGHLFDPMALLTRGASDVPSILALARQIATP